MSLEELNVMILERDPKIRPMETPQEAIAFLSRDFNPNVPGANGVQIPMDQAIDTKVQKIPFGTAPVPAVAG